MVPLGEDLQGGSNHGGKALSDTQVPSLRFRQLATQGSNHLVKEGAYGSVEPKPTWSSNMLFHVVKNVQGSPVTLATDCSLSNKRGICVQGHMQSGFELTDSAYTTFSTVFQNPAKNGRIPYTIFFAPRIQHVGRSHGAPGPAAQNVARCARVSAACRFVHYSFTP